MKIKLNEKINICNSIDNFNSGKINIILNNEYAYICYISDGGNCGAVLEEEYGYVCKNDADKIKKMCLKYAENKAKLFNNIIESLKNE